MSIHDITPKLLLAFVFRNTSNETRSILKRAVSPRLFALKCGQCSFEVDGRFYNLTSGDIMFLPSQTDYTTIFQDGRVEIYNLLFDFTGQQRGFNDRLIHSLFSSEALVQVEFNDCLVYNKPRLFSPPPSAWAYLDSIFALNRTRPDCYGPSINGKLSLLLAGLAQARETTVPLQKVDAVLAYINANVYNDISCQTVAGHFSYHPNYLNKLVKRLTGRTLQRQILYCKCRAGAKALLETDAPITKIAHDLGFYDSSHFCNAFFEELQVLPSIYRKHI